MHTVQSAEPALPFRSDTMLGVCEALGQDFGFHPNLLRIALGSIVLFSPLAAFGIYLGLGVIVALSRIVAPQRLVPTAPAAQNEAELPENDRDEELQLAA